MGTIIGLLTKGDITSLDEGSYRDDKGNVQGPDEGIIRDLEKFQCTAKSSAITNIIWFRV